jgi:hypothetical protein
MPQLRFAFALVKTTIAIDFTKPLLVQTQLLHLGHIQDDAKEGAANKLVETALDQLALISAPCTRPDF